MVSIRKIIVFQDFRWAQSFSMWGWGRKLVSGVGGQNANFYRCL